MTTCNIQPSTCTRCGKETDMPFHTCVKAAGLTPRQAEVMREICKGKIGKEIGRDMGVSTRTVETHIQLAKRALGARNIVQAAVLFALGDRDKPKGWVDYLKDETGKVVTIIEY